MRILVTGGLDTSWTHSTQVQVMEQVRSVLKGCWDLSTALGENLYVTHLGQPAGVDQWVDQWTRRRLEAGPEDHTNILVLENEFEEPYTSRHYDLVVIFGPEGWDEGQEPVTSAMKWAMQVGTPLKLVMWEEM